MTAEDPAATAARRQAAARDAALWLARIDLGTADPAVFERWRGAHVDHAVAFARMAGAIEQAARDPQAAEATQPSRRNVLRGVAAAGVAAVIATGLGTSRAYAWETATSAVGECRPVRLPDGSGAKLNTDSRLSWRFNADGRTLWIGNGEVALDLQPGPACVLHASGQAVALRPGRYNARLRGGTLDLLVLRGRAMTGPPGGAAPAATAGEGLLMPGGAPVIRSASADEVAAALAWLDGEILFQHETLGSAVDEYNRYLSRKIVIVDHDLARIPVGGRFTSNDPKAFLNALRLSLGITVSSSETGLFLTR